MEPLVGAQGAPATYRASLLKGVGALISPPIDAALARTTGKRLSSHTGCTNDWNASLRHIRYHIGLPRHRAMCLATSAWCGNAVRWSMGCILREAEANVIFRTSLFPVYHNKNNVILPSLKCVTAGIWLYTSHCFDCQSTLHYKGAVFFFSPNRIRRLQKIEALQNMALSKTKGQWLPQRRAERLTIIRTSRKMRGIVYGHFAFSVG
jgi:hypothetical protein